MIDPIFLVIEVALLVLMSILWRIRAPLWPWIALNFLAVHGIFLFALTL